MTATATATEPERSFTAREAAQAIAECSPGCASALAWQVVEEFNLTVYPPRHRGDIWIVFGSSVGPEGIYGVGETAVGAVENFLRSDLSEGLDLYRGGIDRTVGRGIDRT